MSAEREKIIMDKSEIAAAVERMALDIAEANKGIKDLVLVGIMNRGVPIAERIAKILEKSGKIDIPVGTLDISLYRDDITNKGSGIEIKKSDMPFSLDGKTVILVDDVIFAGRTIRAALDGLGGYGRASKVELAVLVDRGHRELPIHPDFTGKKIPTSPSEEVLVNVSEIDGVDKVVLR